MTISDVVLEIGRIKPHAYTEDTLRRWLSELDGKVWEDLMCHYQPAEMQPALPYAAKDTLAVLLIPFPHEDVYIKWLCAQIDYHNGDVERYNNSMMMFAEEYQTFVDSYTRSHVGKAVKLKGLRGTIA